MDVMDRAREVLRDSGLQALFMSPASNAHISRYSTFMCPSAVSSLICLRLLTSTETTSIRRLAIFESATRTDQVRFLLRSAASTFQSSLTP